MASTVFYYFCSLYALGIALANSNSKCSDYVINHACFGMVVERVVGSDSEYTVYSCSCLPLFFYRCHDNVHCTVQVVFPHGAVQSLFQDQGSH